MRAIILVVNVAVLMAERFSAPWADRIRHFIHAARPDVYILDIIIIIARF